jgi:acyl carrier protein
MEDSASITTDRGCWHQVVANPFIWSRLARPGQPVPHLFSEFKPEEGTQPSAMALEDAEAVPVQAAQRAISTADALADIMDILRGMLGAQVSTAWDTPCCSACKAAVAVRHLKRQENLLLQQAATDQAFMEAGLDSLGAVELRNAIGARFGMELPATVTFDYPTPAVLAAYIAAHNAATAPQAAAPTPALVNHTACSS